MSKNVVGIGVKQNAHLVQTLEILLRDAKLGRVTTLVGFVVREGMVYNEVELGYATELECMGALTRLTIKLSDLIDGYDEE